MRRLLLPLGVVFLLVATMAGAEEASGPRIRVEPTSFDFGRVLPQRTLRKEFRLRNLGDQDLEIEGISRSCGCTNAATEVSALGPGEATALLVSLKTRRSPGPIVESVVLRSNDPATPLLKIQLRATVVAE